MDREKFNKMKQLHRERMGQELLRVQMELDERGYVYVGILEFAYSEYWIEIETECANGRVISHYFACDSAEAMKNAICWIINETSFSAVTAFARNRSYVTFRNQEDIDMFFDLYYGENHEGQFADYRDYSPSCPWNAPGMSIDDFI